MQNTEEKWPHQNSQEAFSQPELSQITNRSAIIAHRYIMSLGYYWKGINSDTLSFVDYMKTNNLNNLIINSSRVYVWDGLLTLSDNVMIDGDIMRLIYPLPPFRIPNPLPPFRIPIVPASTQRYLIFNIILVVGWWF